MWPGDPGRPRAPGAPGSPWKGHKLTLCIDQTGPGNILKAGSGFAPKTVSKLTLENERKLKYSHHVLVCLVVQVDLKVQLHPEEDEEVTIG